AKQWASDTESGIRKGEFKNVVRTAASKTLQDVIDRFRKEVFVHRAESTKRAEGSFLAYWEKTLGQYSLAYITADMVGDRLAELAAAGDGRRKLPEERVAPKNGFFTDDEIVAKIPKIARIAQDAAELVAPFAADLLRPESSVIKPKTGGFLRLSTRR